MKWYLPGVCGSCQSDPACIAVYACNEVAVPCKRIEALEGSGQHFKAASSSLPRSSFVRW